MKKSKLVSLVLITSALASCTRPPIRDNDWDNSGNVYMRGDSTAKYQRPYYNNHLGMWYYAFRPYGYYNYYGHYYSQTGYYSSSISHESNIGNASSKSGVSRGGFGGGRSSVSS